MHKLAELCVRRPVFASVLVLSLVVMGLFSYFQLGVDRFPNIDFPFVTITTRLVGAAPEEMETEVTDKVEEAVNTISGIDQLISVSSEGISVVTVSFLLAVALVWDDSLGAVSYNVYLWKDGTAIPTTPESASRLRLAPTPAACWNSPAARSAPRPRPPRRTP